MMSSLRQGDLPAVPFSFSAWVEINGVEYAAVQIAVTQSKVESRAVCELAVGTNTRDLQGRKSVPANFLFVRGTPAKVYLKVDEDVGSVAPASDTRQGRSLLLQQGTHLLFNGVVDDGGPSNLTHGRFNLRVVIVSRLIYLATGSLMFAGLPSGFLNASPANLTNPEIFPVKIDPGVARSDFWAAMQAAYTSAVNYPDYSTDRDNALDIYINTFDAKRSVANAALLAEIKGGLPGGIFKDTVMSSAVCVYFNAELKYDLAQQSILQRIRALSEDFHFALVEHGLGYAVVPYTPFVPQSAIKTTIWPDTVYSAQWTARSTASVAGAVFIDNLQGSLFGWKNDLGAGTYKILGKYTRPGSPLPKNDLDPNGLALGMIIPLPAPTWISVHSGRPETQSQINDAIGGVTNLADLQKFGDPYCRELALKQTYMARSLTVECPLRMDIGVCSPVKLVYPDIAGTGLATAAAVYGAVESVSIVLDATSRRAVTVLEIMYVRSEQQQIQDIDPGPFGSGSGAPSGTRLDEHPDAGGPPATPTAAG
jgi:hypothetical protein